VARLYSGVWGCQWWVDGAECGVQPSRRYTNGWYCVDHTPARRAGRPEPGAAWYLHLLKPMVVPEFRLIGPKEIWQQNKRDRIARERAAREARRKES